jgi:Rieske Fe-S protein
MNGKICEEREAMPMLSKDLFTVWRQSKQQISRRRLLALMGAGGAAATATLSGCSLGPLDLGGGSNTASGGGTTTTSQGMQVATQQATPEQTAAPTQASMQGSDVLAKVAQVPVNSARTFPIANQSNPGVLIHLPDQHFVAYNSTCTHEQCAVAYNPQSHMLECPCHGSVFNPAQNGAVVQGPASTPLAPIKIVVNSNGTITTA